MPVAPADPVVLGKKNRSARPSNRPRDGPEIKRAGVGGRRNLLPPSPNTRVVQPDYVRRTRCPIELAAFAPGFRHELDHVSVIVIQLMSRDQVRGSYTHTRSLGSCELSDDPSSASGNGQCSRENLESTPSGSAEVINTSAAS